MVIIMWACVCIILHNLIICIEGNNFDEEWREGLVRTGLGDEHSASGDTDEEDGPKGMLEQVQQQVETPGQHFRLKVMNDLFNSPFHRVEHCP